MPEMNIEVNSQFVLAKEIEVGHLMLNTYGIYSIRYHHHLVFLDKTFDTQPLDTSTQRYQDLGRITINIKK